MSSLDHPRSGPSPYQGMRVKLQMQPQPDGSGPDRLRWSVSLQQDDGSWVTSSGTSSVDDGDLVHRSILKALSQVLGSADHG